MYARYRIEIIYAADTSIFPFPFAIVHEIVRSQLLSTFHINIEIV